MSIVLRHVATVLALVAGTAAAQAQTWVVDPVESETIVTRPLAPVSRTTVYRSVQPQGGGLAPIVRERIVTERYAPGPLVRETIQTPVVEAYAYQPGYAPVANTYAYSPTYAAPVANAYAYSRTYRAPVADAYAYSPVETVVAPRARAYVVDRQIAGPRYVYEVDTPIRDAAYCRARYRSYDPVSGTYLGYDGLRHPCN